MSKFIKLNEKYINKSLITEFYLDTSFTLNVKYLNEILVIKTINDNDPYISNADSSDEYLLSLLL